MGYLDNQSITVDAILTKRGRELLSRNDGSFRITQFALGDDEIDYTLFNVSKVTLTIGSSFVLNPTTHNFNGSFNLTEPGGYMATIADRRLLVSFQGLGRGQEARSTRRPYTSTAVSETVMGNSIQLTAINSTSLFGTNNKLLTTITIEGVDSGARTTIPVEISKQVIASSSPQGQTGIVLR
jgi:hypothetical protein